MNPFHGIDVSHWQKNINWLDVKNAGIDFAIIRSGYATTLDRCFHQNTSQANAVHLPIGIYHYSYATTPAQAKQEAQFVLNAIASYPITYPVFFDIEDQKQVCLTNPERTDLILAFCHEMNLHGYSTGVYASLTWFNSMLEVERLHHLEKWIAQWNAPKCKFQEDFSIWQYSSTGSIAGICGPVDLNLCYKHYN